MFVLFLIPVCTSINTFKQFLTFLFFLFQYFSRCIFYKTIDYITIYNYTTVRPCYIIFTIRHSFQKNNYSYIEKHNTMLLNNIPASSRRSSTTLAGAKIIGTLPVMPLDTPSTAVSTKIINSLMIFLWNGC